MQPKQKKRDGNLTGTYIGSMCVALGLLVGMTVASLWLFFSGMGEGLLMMFPVAFLGAAILFIHSIVARKKRLLIVAVIILIAAVSIVASMALGLFS